MLVIRENVVSRLHARMAREPALGVIPLLRMVSQGAGRERIGCSVIVERGPSPPAALREPVCILAVIFICSIHLIQHFHLYELPMDFARLGPVGELHSEASTMSMTDLVITRVPRIPAAELKFVNQSQ